MKKLLLSFAAFFIAFAALAQIEIKPSGNNGLGNPFTGSINSDKNKPFWIGVGDYSHIYLDSSESHKIGIGTALRAPLFNKRHNFHAKFHIRHAGSPSNTSFGAGPHLLLDEATANSPAVIRFRQSTTTSTGSGGTLDETLVPGARYWDIRGYANSSSVAQDNLKFVNSGNTNDVINLTGEGSLTLTGNINPEIILKNTATGSIKKIEFGIVGEGSNGGRIWYANEIMSLYANAKKSLTLSPEGYVTIGSNPLAPAIKTWYNTITLASTVGVSTGMPMPCPKDDILSVSIMYNKNNGYAAAMPVTEWAIDNTTMYIENTQTGAAGKTVRVFITYREQPN